MTSAMSPSLFLDGDDDLADLSLMMEAFAEAWVVSNPSSTFLSDVDDEGAHFSENREVGKDSPSAEMDDVIKDKAIVDENNCSTEATSNSQIESNTINEAQLQNSDRPLEANGELSCPLINSLNPSSISKGQDTVDLIVPPSSPDLSQPRDFSVECEIEDATRSPIPWRRRLILGSWIKAKDLAQFVLLKAGRIGSKADVPRTRVFLSIPPWQPLDLRALVKNLLVSVGEFLKPLKDAEQVTIKVVVDEWRRKDLLFKWNDEAVRTTLTALLRHYSQKRLAALCPLSQSYISTIVASSAAESKSRIQISESKCAEFGIWFEQFTKRVISSAAASAAAAVPATASAAAVAKGECGPDQRPIQISFHADHELPQLKRWFADHPVPTEAEFASFASALNGGAWRQRSDRVRVTEDKLRNWWKNERARMRRSERRKRKVDE